jgi:hypothetical protein
MAFELLPNSFVSLVKPFGKPLAKTRLSTRLLSKSLG